MVQLIVIRYMAPTPTSTGSCQSEGHARQPKSFERRQGFESHKIWDAKLDETFGYWLMIKTSCQK